nr:reverse transcriptase domain-containing protein [Tanacetum cinerariifolium]
MLVHQGEGSGTPTEPHHTPFPEAETSHPPTSSIPLPSIPTAPIPHVTQPDPTPIQQYTRRARIAQSSALPTVADEPASPIRTGQPLLSPPPFLMIQHQGKGSQVLEDREGNTAKQSRDDVPIKGRSINEGEEAAERISNDSEEIARVLTSMDVATVLAGGIDVPTSSGSIPTAGPPATIISTGSEVGPTASLIVTRKKGKEVMVESDTPKKKKLQEQIDAQVSRELEEQQEKEDMRMNEQIARDAEVARIHIEEELQGMIDSLDKSNETTAKYLQEYQEFASSQQRRLMTKKQKREYYMAVIKSNLGWRFKDFKGMTFEEIEAKFAEVWKQVEDFTPMGSKEETKRLKRKGLNLEKEQVKKQKSSEEAPEIETSTKEFTEEKMKEMMQLVLVEDVYVQALQNFMHAPVEWKLYDLSGVHHLTAKDREIFMLVEKDYPFRKGLALVMISYKLQGYLHVLFQSLDDVDALDFWRNQDSWRIRSWRLYPRVQVHVLEMVDGWVIHMFVDVSYPLTVATLERMLKHGLEVPKLLVGGNLTMAEQLVSRVGFSTTPQMVFSSPWLTAEKELTHHDENMLVEVGKFTFLVDFIILEMEEDSKVLIILGRPFLHTANAVIQVKQKQLNLGVGTRQMIFNIDAAMKHSHSNDDSCVIIDVIDEILEEDFDALLDEATVLAGGIDVPTGSGSIPTADPPATIISTGSEVGPTASPIVTRRKGKEVMVESDTPKKKKLQEQIDAQVARELEEQQEKKSMRMNEQIARDVKVARIHAEEELQGMIDSLDKSNETIAKYLQEYQDFASDLPLEKRIELISDLVEDFIPIGSKEETERLKRKGLNLEKEQVKKQKSLEEAPEIETSTEEFTEEKIKEMMQLVLVEDVYVQALQVKHPIID